MTSTELAMKVRAAASESHSKTRFWVCVTSSWTARFTVARGVGCGQRLASRARGGGLGDISIRIRRGDAADGEGHEEEKEHNDGVGILQCPDGLVQGLGMAPSRRIGGEESQVVLQLQFRVHDVLLLGSSETRMRGLMGR